MSTRKKPAWRALLIIGLGSACALYVESRLPVDSQAHTWLLLAWVALFYGALTIWTKRNSEALDNEPPALDCTGRPIIDTDDQPAAKVQPKSRAYKPYTEPLYFGSTRSRVN